MIDVDIREKDADLEDFKIRASHFDLSWYKESDRATEQWVKMMPVIDVGARWSQAN